jgi:hypothetical protein
LPRPVTIAIVLSPASIASSTPYCKSGLVNTGNISLGMALVAGKNRVPYPAAGNKHFLIIFYPKYIIVLRAILYKKVTYRK